MVKVKLDDKTDKTIRKKFNSSTGFSWCRKRNNKLARMSQTPGKQKGWHCTADSEERYFASRHRSYKHRNYKQWSKRHTGTAAKGQL